MLWRQSPCGNYALAVTRSADNRSGAAAVEFAVIAPILFMIFLGMIEIGRAMMVAGAVANAARVGARAGTLVNGSYTGISTAVSNCLSNNGLPTTPALTVTINGVTVSDDTSYQAAAVPGANVSVTVSIAYGSASWFPQGFTLFMRSNQPIAGSSTMAKEG
jgi:Flp pilus assembly protein TadG